MKGSFLILVTCLAAMMTNAAALTGWRTVTCLRQGRAMQKSISAWATEPRPISPELAAVRRKVLLRRTAMCPANSGTAVNGLHIIRWLETPPPAAVLATESVQ